MRSSGRFARAVSGSLRAGLVGVLCVLMVEQPLLAGTVVKRGPTAGGAQMLGDARVLHALNRLTFGPRPGDVAAVKAMGLKAWFELQLNPSRIDDSALNARLAMFPAMQLPQAELIARYPSQQMIRQLVQSNTWLPADPVEGILSMPTKWRFTGFRRISRMRRRRLLLLRRVRVGTRWRGIRWWVRLRLPAVPAAGGKTGCAERRCRAGIWLRVRLLRQPGLVMRRWREMLRRLCRRRIWRMGQRRRRITLKICSRTWRR